MIRGKRNPIVHVVAVRKNAESSIQIKVTPDVLDMTEYAKGMQVITWKLDTVGFHFAAKDPIEFTSPGWEKSFGKVEIDPCGTKVRVQNKNRDGEAFAYNVRVVEKKSGVEVMLDPTIQNNMP